MNIKFFNKLAFTSSFINWAGRIGKYSWQVTYFKDSAWFEYENYLEQHCNIRVIQLVIFKILFGLEWEI